MTKNSFVAEVTFKGKCSPHIETSQPICKKNQLTDFYMRGTVVIKGLKPVYLSVYFLLV